MNNDNNNPDLENQYTDAKETYGQNPNSSAFGNQGENNGYYNSYNPNGSYNNFNGYRPNGYNQYNTGFPPYNFDPEFFNRRNREKKALWRLGLFTGGAVLSFIIIQNILVMLLYPLGLYELYLSNEMFQCGADIILSVFGILIPFAIFGKYMKKNSGIGESLPLSAPEGKLNTFLAVIAGLGICMVANYVTAIGVTISDFSGVELSSPEIALPDGPFGILLSVVRVAVVAAVVEELSLRGFVMQNLRKYGDSFAIVMTAIVFALMHGNLVQSPFALIAGIGLGYFSVKTNSLWTGIIIHCFNNLFSTVISYLSEYYSDRVVNSVYYVIFLSLIIGGIICLFLFMKRTKDKPLKPNTTTLTTGQRFGTFISSPTMILSIIYIVFSTITYINIT